MRCVPFSLIIYNSFLTFYKCRKMQEKTFRVMTYNVHSCIGQDGLVSTFRIARVIAEYEPDVVALQELDAWRPRTGRVHQAEEIARHLNMDFHFHPSMEIKEERYGNAILSRYPISLKHAGPLPSYKKRPLLERRGALWAAINFFNKEIQIINTHLGLNRFERMAQADALLGSQWALNSSCKPPLIVCGDFNAIPLSSVYRKFKKILKDAQVSISGLKPENTYPSRYPIFRIDHIFTSGNLSVKQFIVPRNKFTNSASDHLPLIVDIAV